MNCANCSAAMLSDRFEAHLNRSVDIDYCPPCQAFWFDRVESLQITTRSTLKLFRLIGDAAAQGRPKPWQRTTCPRCEIRLLHTRDIVKNTPFEYWRCPREHGRLISFYDFLREKNFIKPLTATEIVELKRRLESIHCSNCGAPIDLTRHSSCSHCGAALSLLDLDQADRLIAELRHAEEPAAPPSAASRPIEERSHDDVSILIRTLAAKDAGPQGLIGAGLQSLIKVLSKTPGVFFV